MKGYDSLTTTYRLSPLSPYLHHRSWKLPCLFQFQSTENHCEKKNKYQVGCQLVACLRIHIEGNLIWLCLFLSHKRQTQQPAYQALSPVKDNRLKIYDTFPFYSWIWKMFSEKWRNLATTSLKTDVSRLYCSTGALSQHHTLIPLRGLWYKQVSENFNPSSKNILSYFIWTWCFS